MLRVKNIFIDGSSAPDGVTHWDASAYERAVRSNILRIASSQVGPVVIRYATFGERVLIVPIAYTSRGRVPRATGGGDEFSRLQVRFTPAHWVGPDSDGIAPRGQAPYRSDEVLLHEIFHCVQLRFASRRDVDGPSAYDISSVDERRAVMITNMYRSESGRPLRGPYHAYWWMTGNGTAEALFRATGHAGFMGFRTMRRVRRVPGDLRHTEAAAYWRRFMAKFRSDFPGLSAELAAIPTEFCPYNPFADRRRSSDFLYVPSDWHWDSGAEDPGNLG